MWFFTFLAIPILYFIAQFIPYYHSGGTVLPSLGELFWFPERNEQTTNFISLFYFGFRINEFTAALLGTQFFALLFLVTTLILKSSGIVALMIGCWGVYGLIAFFTTRALTFSPVMVYGGIAGILMLVIFLAAVVVSAIYMYMIYKNYRIKYVLPFKAERSI